MIEETFTKICQSYSDDTKLIRYFFSEISKEYNSKERFYHNFAHINRMLNQLLFFENDVESYENLALAIMYHDVIYNPKRSDNEEESAKFACKQLELLNFSEKDISRIESLIISTKEHKTLLNTFDEKLLLDLDLFILGSSEAEYLSYTANIRKEYNFIPIFLYRKKRKEVMQTFLKNKRIFLTDYFSKKYEKQARRNIEKEISSLSRLACW